MSYAKTWKNPAKKYGVKVAETEKVCTFATAFERESRWRWQTGRAEATGESADCCTEYLTLRMRKGARKDKPHAFWEPSENFFQKTFEKIWRLQKNALPLQTLSHWNGSLKEKIVLWKTLDKQTRM